MPSKSLNEMLAADNAKNVVVIPAGGDVEITAADKGEGKLPTFSFMGYTGAVMNISGFFNPIILDLEGVTVAEPITALMNHDDEKIVGQGTAVVSTEGVRATGTVMAEDENAARLTTLSKNGFKWQASVGANIQRREFLEAGKKATVNGREVSGPLIIARESLVHEISFVRRGADSNTSAAIAASHSNGKATVMDPKFATWLEAAGFTHHESLTAQMLKPLEAQWKLESNPQNSGNASLDDVLAKAEANERRVGQITALTQQALLENPTRVEEIKVLAHRAIEDKVDIQAYELSLLRQLRSPLRVPTFEKRSGRNDPLVIEAAMCMAVGMPVQFMEKHYKEETLDAVDRSGMRSNFSLQQLLMQVACANGYHGSPGERVSIGNLRTVLEYCFPPSTVKASMVSTISLAGILGNVANKSILAGYMEEDQSWKEIATVKSVSNFHQHTHYRMLDSLEYEEIGPSGELKHGTLSQESYTSQAKTYGKMIAFDRRDIINDDLGALDSIREILGRGAAKKFANVFWAAFMNNASFFTTALTNYIEGSTTNLGTDGVGLQLGVTAYRSMTSPSADGSKRVGVAAGRPTILLVPPVLEFNARRYYQSLNLVGGSSTVPDANIFAGLYRPVIQDRLSDSSYTGYSTTAWYLFGDNVKPMLVTLLNGNATPIVESTDADFQQLGIQFRGYHDFGCDKSEYLSGIKSKGAT